MKILFILLLLPLSIQFKIAQGQSYTIKGVVWEKENHQPLPGACIVPLNMQKKGTITDLDGKFSIRVPVQQEMFRISYLGKKTLCLQLSDSIEHQIELEDEDQKLKEVTIKGDSANRHYYIYCTFHQVERKDWFYRLCRKLFKHYPIKYWGAECRTESGKVKE